MQTVCGYRVIREVTGGERSRVLLVHDHEDRVVVVRVLDRALSPAEVAATVQVMTAVDHPSLLPLADVAVQSDGSTAIVTPRLAGGTLGELIAGRGGIAPGEAVTVLTAIIGALRALHGAGWAHGRVEPRSILLASDGTPVLAGFGSAARLGPDVDTSEDIEAVIDLCRLLLASTPRAEHALRRFERETPTLDAIEWALAEIADAAPVLLSAPPRTVSERARFEQTAPAGRADPFAFLVRSDSGNEGEALTLRRGLIDRFFDAEGLAGVARPLLASLRAVRRPVWIAAGAVGAALIVAITLVPAQSDPTSDADAAAVPKSLDAADVETPTSPMDEPTVPQAPADVETSTAELGGADDPLDAARQLLRTRRLCFETADADCLARVDGADSAALSDDLATLDDIADGGAVPAAIALGDAPFVQRTGDSAIIAGEQVSILLVRGADGWRIRDTFDDTTAG
ncbi:protein kinase [Herbiconiux sp. L3-i23]|uniref:protein kinase domain-containing protein n=1 Tax=Herbiconiux sp. L3-i23 TaxID=2905871 RepID=UPI00204CE76D|nr:protein kinase [Herbiconiux sp. L3-i23]BDI22897.1 hypothetical protein L3i23_16730 [Herbiconiux sp. L3-i23]